MSPSEENITSRCDALNRKIHAGIATTMEALIDMGKFLTQTELASCTRSYAELGMVFEIINNHWAAVVEQMTKGEEIAQAVGISQVGLQGMYDLAKKLFEHQHFEEAMSAFCLLSLLAPEQKVFWLGLGHAEYCLGNYKDANIAYTMVSEVDPKDPAPHLFMAHCFRALKEDHLIGFCFTLAEQAANTKEEKIRTQEAIHRLQEVWRI